MTDPLKERPVILVPSALGMDLPVIDVTHPAFALDTSPAAAVEMRRKFREFASRQKAAPPFAVNAFLWIASLRSALFRAFNNPKKGYLGGLHTYVMKLGANNLVPPFTSWFDRYVADLPPVFSLRLRLQQTAELISEGLIPLIEAEPGKPVHMLNIGGGPAMDSLNALILCRRAVPKLSGAKVRIHVLDGDPQGPDFGRACLAALQRDGGPLAGLDITLQHVPYEWRDTAPLSAFIQTLDPHNAILIASSEGALFEYGEDQNVLDNLTALRAHGHGIRFIVGSVTRNDEFTRTNTRYARFNLQDRGTEGAAALALQAGFAPDAIREAFLSDQVRLKRID